MRPVPTIARDMKETPPKSLHFTTILALIPRERRRGAVGTVLASVALALLDFVGIAVLVPVLLLVLSEEATFAYPAMRWLYEAGGFTSFGTFVCAVCAAAVVVIILKSLLTLTVSDAVTKYLLSLYRHYSTRMFDTCLSRGVLFIRKHHTSQLINNVNGVCLRFTEGVLGQLFAIATEIVLLGLVAAALLWYDPRLVLLALAVFLPLTLIYALVFRRRMNENGRTENRLFVTQNKTLYETLRGYSDIEINNAERYVSDRFRRGLLSLTECRRRALLVRTAAGRMAEFSLILGIVILIVAGVAGGTEMATLKISLGIFAVAAYKIVPSVNRIVNSWVEYKRNAFAAEKIAETLVDAPPVRFAEHAAGRLPFEREIAVEDVTFRYEPGGKAVLEHFSLIVRKGERIGIRGYSGAGKTTLFNLLCGFFPPESGEIRVDGTPLSPANIRPWQHNLAYVSQDVFLPDMTLAENIAFGLRRDRIDPQRLEQAIRAASLTELIASLPQGVDTVTGEGGCRLSGGQRQRIGIARALYKQASVLLFDEATSSLDSRTEREIVEAVEELSERHSELTILIISHREQTLAFCDRIIDIG